MKSTKRTSILLVTALLLTSASVFANKPNKNNCPCHLSEPGLREVINEINTETCVTENLLWNDNHAGEKRMEIKVLTLNESDTCLLSYITSEFSRCVIMKGEMIGEVDECGPSDVEALILEISEEQYKDCEYALRKASQFLETTSMCY